MHISIIGKAGSGKTTLFNALAGGTPSGNGNSKGIVAIEIPDERLEYLAGVFNPRKTVYARLELADTAAIDKGDLQDGNFTQKSLHYLRESDAFLLILQNFDNGINPNPVSDFHSLQAEFILSDMAQIEARLARMEKQYGKKNNPSAEQERLLLELCLDHLNKELPLSNLALDDGDDRRIRGFQFFSRKPMMVVVNCSEKDVASTDMVAEKIGRDLPDALPILAACAKLESELASMSPEEQSAFMDDYRIKESLRGRIIRLAAETLGIISFLTVGEDECRAWPLNRGMSAQEAAGIIHTDLANKFIRAETVSYEDFVAHGGFAGCKKAGLWRLEGKTYVVKDGDILSIRAGS